jgi:hypothetical protein
MNNVRKLGNTLVCNKDEIKGKNFVVIIVYHGDCRRSSCNYNGHHIDNKCNGHSQKVVKSTWEERLGRDIRWEIWLKLGKVVMEDSGVELVMSCPSRWEDKIARKKGIEELG